MVFIAGVQESIEDETNISPNKDEDEDEDFDDDQKDLDEFEREIITGVKICTIKSCIESFIKGSNTLKKIKSGKPL